MDIPRDEYSSHSMVCPACKKEHDPEPEDYTEDTWEIKCDCGCRFEVTGESSFSWSTEEILDERN